MSENQAVNDAFERLQRLLLTLRDGDRLAAREAARLTGLAETTCQSVLEGLAKAGHMSHEGGDQFVRVTAT